MDTSLYNANAALQAPGSMSGGLSATTGAGASTPSLTGTPGTTGGGDPGLQSFLASNYDPYASTIMSQYNQANQATSAAAASNAQQITDTGNYNIGYQSDQDKATGTQALESQRGFVVNPGQISLLQEQSTKRIKDLTQQMSDALANNQTSLASSLAGLALQENTALTNARTTFLSQYFQGKQEQRAEQSFQTPEQQSVMAMATANPGAGILPTDSLAQAQAKVTSSPTYQLGLQSAQSTIGLQGAQAGLASTQAAQQKIINNFMQGNTTQFSGDVSGLLSGTVSDATLHAKYDSFPGGAGAAIIANIESQAQSQGWQPFQASLTQSAQQSQNTALNSGNPFSLFGAGLTQGIGALSSALGGSGSAASVFGNSPASVSPFTPTNATTGTTSSGIKYTITP